MAIVLGKTSGGTLTVSPTDGVTNTSLVLPASGTVATLTDVNAVSSVINSHIGISGVTAYHLLQGNLAVDSSVTTQGFNTTLYTGNGSTQSINTGVDMSTQWGSTAEEKFGGLVWLKGRSGVTNHRLFNSIDNKSNSTNSTSAQSSDAAFHSFLSNGFSVSTSDADFNTSAATYASWNFQTTHRVTGTTNHGKAYTCHYNPFTGFTMVQFTGSGLAGHEIPHMLGRKLGFAAVKSTTSVTNWRAYVEALGLTNSLYLSTTAAMFASTDWSSTTETALGLNTGAEVNAGSTTYIMYGWANSYFDESNKLIGNYELVTYQGTGAAGNKVQTKGKPAWVIIKRIDSTGNWEVFDNLRNGSGANNDGLLYTNLSNAEATTSNRIDFISDGFVLQSTDTDNNASGATYIALVAYDTNSNGGGTYYPLASDTANLQVNNALIPIAQGIDSNGVKNTILSKNETVTGLTYTQGKNYVYYDVLGNKGVSAHKPRYLASELVRSYAGESPDYYNVKENKWYSTNSGSELVTNGTFDSNTTGWTASNATLTIDNARLLVTSTTTSSGIAYQAITTVVGKTYRIKLGVYGGTHAAYWGVGTTIGGYDIINYSAGVAAGAFESFSYSFVAQSTTTYINLFTTSAAAGRTAYFDNVTVFESVITPTTEITNGRNYLNHIVYADNDGGLLYVEELPKVEYKDEIKANDFRGKNACTAWVNFDGTTTPPTIRDSYNVSSIVRTGSNGVFDIYFKTPMDNTDYTWNGTGDYRLHFWGSTTFATTQYLNKVNIIVQAFSTGTGTNPAFASITIFGGKK